MKFALILALAAFATAPFALAEDTTTPAGTENKDMSAEGHMNKAEEHANKSAEHTKKAKKKMKEMKKEMKEEKKAE
jgi:hypothetical protein